MSQSEVYITIRVLQVFQYPRPRKVSLRVSILVSNIDCNHSVKLNLSSVDRSDNINDSVPDGTKVRTNSFNEHSDKEKTRVSSQNLT